MKKSELYAYTGTIISGIIILLILFFVFLPGLETPDDEGVMISFGNAVDGAGTYVSETPRQEARTTPPVSTKKEELLTQDAPSVSVNDNNKKTNNNAAQAEQAARDERLRKEQEASRQADDLIGGTFGSSPAAGSGNTTSNNTAGNPVGSGTSGGNSWSLSGRNLVGSMPTPRYDQNEEGFLTVEIKVDASGTVVSATIKRGTITNPSLRKAAETAALKTKFSSGSGPVVGTITYNFKLR